MRNFSKIESISVFDLDGTLISGDISRFLFEKSTLILKIKFLLIRMISGKDSLRRALVGYSCELDMKVMRPELLDYLQQNTDIRIRDIVEELRENHILILSSASPRILVEVAAQHFGFVIG